MWKRSCSCPGRSPISILGAGALVAGLIFIGMLVLGLADVWVKGDLEWVREEERRALKARPGAETSSASGAAA